MNTQQKLVDCVVALPVGNSCILIIIRVNNKTNGILIIIRYQLATCGFDFCFLCVHLLHCAYYVWCVCCVFVPLTNPMIISMIFRLSFICARIKWINNAIRRIVFGSEPSNLSNMFMFLVQIIWSIRGKKRDWRIGNRKYFLKLDVIFSNPVSPFFFFFGGKVVRKYFNQSDVKVDWINWILTMFHLLAWLSSYLHKNWWFIPLMQMSQNLCVFFCVCVCFSVSVSRVIMRIAFFALQFNSILKIKVWISSNLPTNNVYEWTNEMKPKTDDKILNMKKKNITKQEANDTEKMCLQWMMNNKTKTWVDAQPIWMSEWKKKNIL